jgi:multisubunit Na+/H+ antiporter MnhC subunit
MVIIAFFAGVCGILYNLVLVIHLYREKVSNSKHELYLRKKEIEYIVGISEMWNNRFFFAFSSFRSDISKMYHRPIFNMLILTYIVVHAAVVSLIN